MEIPERARAEPQQLWERQSKPKLNHSDFEEKEFDGDVKYHFGFTTHKTLKNNKELKMNLVPNPSHLETVGPIVEGIARAKIDKIYKGDNSKLLPIIVVQ